MCLHLLVSFCRDFLKGEHADQITLVAGNFSDNIPTLGYVTSHRVTNYVSIETSHCSCDCYILKDILQNWSDEDAAGILKKLRKVVAVGNRLLVIERVMHTGSYPEERVSIVMRRSSYCYYLLLKRA